MLTALGVEFEAVVPEVEERSEGAPPEALVVENARRKAWAGLELAGAGEGALALGVDTDVVLDGSIVGKAATKTEARERLERLSGRTHEVVSGLVVVGPASGGEITERSGVERSRVTFHRLAADELERYLASGEWRDRAGAYAIQGLGSTLIERLEGDFSNVVGLPLRLLLALAPELLEISRSKV
jgi:nucleoside triphosphate pyrophosphatase